MIMLFPFFQNHGVLGLNARNLLYIKPFNPRKAVAFADDKMKTKAYLSARGIPTAKLYARIETRRQLKQFDFSSLPDRCVLKPNYGYGGEGIIILKGRKNGQFLEQGKTPISDQELREHIEDILDGKFSVNDLPDTAFFEQILESHESFAPFRPAGLPDIRLVVFNLVPVMAMLRVPTSRSEGKANVHLGGIGIGIDLARGVTTHAAQYHHMLREMEHGTAVAGVQIPYWDEMLLIASRIQYITNIGYLAVDLTIDKDLGPVLLEVNARAGLMVQVANLAPLRARLERVGGVKVSTPEKGVRLAQELFGDKIDRRRGEEEMDKPVLAPRETLEITGGGITVEEPCAIAPDKEDTVFSADFLHELQQRGAVEAVKKSEALYRVKFSLAGKKIQTLVRPATIPLAGVRAVIGRRDLAGFLIDPSKKSPTHIQATTIKKDLRAADHMLCSIDRDLQLLKNLRPVNLEEELVRLQDDERYNPVFLQREPTVDLDEVEKSLRAIDGDETPLGILLKKKQRELLLKVELLRARGNAERFSAASMALFGKPSPALIGFANALLQSRVACDLPVKEKDMLSDEETKAKFEEVLMSYGLHDWQVTVKEAMVADCAVGDKRIFIRTGASFSEQHIDSLVAHEIETHVLTAENGAMQPHEIFRRGFANYLDTQEGLAIYNQLRVLTPHHEKRYLHAKGVLAVAYAMEHSFADTRKYLLEELGLKPGKALMKTIDLKRGMGRTEEPGAFTKALSYFRGYRAIEQYARDGGDMKMLYIGKIAIEDLPIVQKIEDVKPPLILPKYLLKKSGQNDAKSSRSRKKKS